MMGQRPSQQNALFYDFCLEKHIPQDHFLRQIDQFLDFESIRSHLKPYYSHTGRPSVDPELMIRMLLIGYCYGIRSERRLCDEVHFNLAYRWFCRLGLEDAVPDHSSFSKNRHGRFRDSDLLRFVFDAVVQQCQEHQLIQGEGFATDASYVRADASWERYATSISDLLAQRRDSRAVREYLDALDEDAGLVSEQKRISQTDPLSRWMLKYGPARFYYCTNYLIDVEHNVIVDVEATPTNRALEVKSTQTMLDRVEEKLGITPKRLLADTAYGTGPMLDWLVNQKGIKPHIPVFDKTRRKDGAFEVGDFQWDDKKSEYRCPGGQALKSHRGKSRTTRNGVTKENTVIYRSRASDCRACKSKSRCCPNTEYRKIARSIYEDSRNIARRITQSAQYKTSQKERRKVEVLFAHLKRILGLDRLRLRGLTGANDEFLLAATVQNLRQLAKTRYKPPDQRISVPT